MRRQGKLSVVLGLLALIVGLIGFAVIRAQAQDSGSSSSDNGAQKCNDCNGVLRVDLGF